MRMEVDGNDICMVVFVSEHISNWSKTTPVKDESWI